MTRTCRICDGHGTFLLMNAGRVAGHICPYCDAGTVGGDDRVWEQRPDLLPFFRDEIILGMGADLWPDCDPALTRAVPR